jgi:hypothetical protein
MDPVQNTVLFTAPDRRPHRIYNVNVAHASDSSIASSRQVASKGRLQAS